jgi:hypothetical protein
MRILIYHCGYLYDDAVIEVSTELRTITRVIDRFET